MPHYVDFDFARAFAAIATARSFWFCRAHDTLSSSFAVHARTYANGRRDSWSEAGHSNYLLSGKRSDQGLRISPLLALRVGRKGFLCRSKIGEEPEALQHPPDH